MKGLLVDYEYCTGCHTCEIACQQVHDLAPTEIGEKGSLGIEVFEIGPFELGNDRYQYEFIPVNTELCDMCAERTAKGKMPSCVKHCQAGCLSFGDVEELSRKITKRKMALLV